MKIESITVYHLRLPLKQAWQTAGGVEHDVDTLYLHARGGGGQAWVECAALRYPHYLPETTASTAVMIRDCFGPLVCGVDFPTAADLYQSLSGFRGNSFARAALEQCWWALTAQAEGKALHELLGGRTALVPAGVTVSGQGGLDPTLEAVSRAIAAGAPRVKLKFCERGDLSTLESVRHAFPELRLQIDCNGGFSLQDMDLFARLDSLALDMIEQPLHFRDLADHAALQQRLHTPICLDESIREPADAERAIRLGAARIINIKPGRVGGLYAALDIVSQCRRAGLGCWVGAMLETVLGTSVNLALATVPGMTHAHDLPIGSRFALEEPASPALTYCQPGQLQPSAAPWVACHVDPDRVRKLAVAVFQIPPRP